MFGFFQKFDMIDCGISFTVSARIYFGIDNYSV